MSDLATIQNVILGQRHEFTTVVSDSSVKFEREAEFAMQVIENNTYLSKIALANQQSLRSAILNVGAIGITLNPASKLAYLVPRKGTVCLDISYMGLLHIAQVSGAIKWGQARIVRKGETFRLRSIDQPPEHEVDPFAEDRGEIVGVYVVVKTDGNDYLTHCMSIADVYRIRDRSEAWKTYLKDKSKKCPWATDEEEMIKKTVIKQASKLWPRRDRLDAAVHYLNTEGDQGIDFEKERSGEKDITPCSEKQQSQILDSLAVLEREEAAFIDYCRVQFKRPEITQVADLTAHEAQLAIAAMSAAVKKQKDEK